MVNDAGPVTEIETDVAEVFEDEAAIFKHHLRGAVTTVTVKLKHRDGGPPYLRVPTVASTTE